MPKLKILVLEMVDAVGEKNKDPQNPPIVQKESCSRMNNPAEESLFVQLQAYINDHRQTLHHDIVLRQSTNTRWVWSQMSKDLSKWEEAMTRFEGKFHLYGQSDHTHFHMSRIPQMITRFYNCIPARISLTYQDWISVSS